MSSLDDPVVASAPKEVPLTNAPLVRVIAQVRFPLIVAIEKRDFIAPFQEAIRARYPVLRQEQPQRVLVGPAGMAPVQSQAAWRFSDVAGTWRVSLTADFLALETTSYKSRSDLLERFRELLLALNAHVAPKVVDRLGVRYIDRIQGPAIQEIGNLVRSEVLGITGTPLAAHAVHAVSETKLAAGDDFVVARWGRLPADATPDPSAIQPIKEPSWFLDLDMFSSGPQPFSVEGILESTARFAERIYTIFRWAVSDEFLRRYGGKV